ncbi:MAG: ATP-binding protein [Limisphaerales bacterium]
MSQSVDLWIPSQRRQFHSHLQAPCSPGKRATTLSWVVWLGVISLLASSCQNKNSPTETLTTVEQISRLSPSELQRGYPVQISGIVTVYDDRWRLLVVQGENQGVAVELKSFLNGIARGDRIEVRGYTAWEGSAPLVVKPRLRRLGAGEMPAAPKADTSALFSGKLDYRLVEMEGEILTSRRVGLYYTEIDALTAGRLVHVYGKLFIRPPSYALYHHRIGIRGVPVTSYSPAREPYAIQFYTSGDEDLRLPPDFQWSGDSTLSTNEQARAGESSLPELNSLREVKLLSNPDADKGYPVHFQAVVTHWDPRRANLTVQDGQAAAYVDSPPEQDSRLSLGSLVEIEGQTRSGNFAPLIRPSRVKVIGKQALPVPLHVLPSEGFAGNEENMWSEIEGVIRSGVPDGFGGAEIELMSGQTRVVVLLQDAPSQDVLEAWIDSEARVRGVFAPIFSSDRQLVGLHLQTPSVEQVTILRPHLGDTFASPPRLIHSLLEYNPQGFPRHRVKVEGRVTYQGMEGLLSYVADDSGGIRIEGADPDAAPLGSSVQVLGFLSQDHSQPVLEHVQIKPAAAPRSEIKPLPTIAEAVLSGEHDGQLISVEGYLGQRQSMSGNQLFLLDSGRQKFPAVLEYPQAVAGWEDLREGALLKLTGVCEMQWNQRSVPPSPETFRLLLRTPADVQVIHHAPWWTLGRAMKILGGLLALVLLAAVWVTALRRRVQIQTSMLRKQMEQREALEAQLRQSQKLESVGRLAGGIAHDFNNMLTVINGYANLLMTDLAGNTEALEGVKEVKKAGERAAQLTRQLLAFSRKQILQPVVLDLNTLVADLEAMLHRLIGEDIELITLLEKGYSRVKVDSGQLTQVLMNLTANARDAMPKGGKLTVEIRNVELDAKAAELHTDVVPGSYVLLAVSDTGTGMDEETRAHLFEPFFTTKDVGKGTGLGLAMIFGIVKQSGGHIWVDSEPGRGATFKIYLPRVSEEETPGKPAGGGEATRGNETVLVVEDQKDVRLLVARSLNAYGYRVLVTPNAEEGLACAQAHAGRIHLLLTDVVMPGMDGKELAARVAKLQPEIRVLYMSGYPESVIAHKGILDPGIDYIQKPFSPDALAARVRDMLKPK